MRDYIICKEDYMAYSTFGTGKWHTYRGENASLPIFERKDLNNAQFVVNGLKTFTYEEIKLKGVPTCVGDVRRLVKQGQFGEIYREVFHDIDEDYFTESDFGLLGSYMDQFLKEIYDIKNPKGTKSIVVSSNTKEATLSKKTALKEKQKDLKAQIKQMKDELLASKEVLQVSAIVF
jgi:hypothetical protein